MLVYLSVFTVGTNNQLYYKGGAIRADTSPAVARNNDGRVQVFVEDVSNQLYYKMQILQIHPNERIERIIHIIIFKKSSFNICTTSSSPVVLNYLCL